MQKFIARQPILDRQEEIYGFELLFREDSRNWCDATNLERKSSNFMVESFAHYGIEDLTGNHRAFINCSRESLVNGYAALLPRERVVLEILETIKPDQEVMEACRNLKRAGYLIALDDFRGELQLPLTEIADIIKVDFLASPPEERRAIEERFASRKIKLLAEKVETREHFRESLEQGYSYFQGYFFAKPEMLSRSAIPASIITYLRALASVTRPEMDIDELAAGISQDLSFSYHLLRVLNSPCCGLRAKVQSVRQAVALLGEREFRKWVMLVAVSGLGGAGLPRC